MTVFTSRIIDGRMRDHPLLSLVVALFSLLLALSLLGLAASVMQFRVDSYGDAVGHVTLCQNYSISGNIIIYLLSVTVVPVLAAIIFCLWFFLAELVGRKGHIHESAAFRLTGLSYAWFALPAVSLGRDQHLFAIAGVAYVSTILVVMTLGRLAGTRKELA